jgi:excisionase family DNA binding protein
MMPDQLLTTEEVAAILALRPQTVRDAVRRGDIPCVRLWTGRKKALIRFQRADIEQFLAERAIPAAIVNERKS